MGLYYLDGRGKYLTGVPRLGCRKSSPHECGAERSCASRRLSGTHIVLSVKSPLQADGKEQFRRRSEPPLLTPQAQCAGSTSGFEPWAFISHTRTHTLCESLVRLNSNFGVGEGQNTDTDTDTDPLQIPTSLSYCACSCELRLQSE